MSGFRNFAIVRMDDTGERRLIREIFAA